MGRMIERITSAGQMINESDTCNPERKLRVKDVEQNLLFHVMFMDEWRTMHKNKFNNHIYLKNVAMKCNII